MDKLIYLENFCKEYARGDSPIFVQKLRNMGFEDIEINLILLAMEETCQVCWNADLNKGKCYCDPAYDI